MKTISFMGKIAALTAIVMSAVTFSAKADDLVVDVQDFGKISASGAVEVSYAQGESFHVVAHGAQRDLENLDVHVSGNTLYIGRRRGMSRSGQVKIEVMAPAVSDFSISGASNLSFASVEVPTAMLRCSGASNIKGSLKAEYLNISCSGASEVKADVNCESVNLTCSGASNVSLKGNSGAVKGSCSGASSVKLNGSSTSAKVSTSGASSLLM